MHCGHGCCATCMHFWQSACTSPSCARPTLHALYTQALRHRHASRALCMHVRLLVCDSKGMFLSTACTSPAQVLHLLAAALPGAPDERRALPAHGRGRAHAGDRDHARLRSRACHRHHVRLRAGLPAGAPEHPAWPPRYACSACDLVSCYRGFSVLNVVFCQCLLCIWLSFLSLWGLGVWFSV